MGLRVVILFHSRAPKVKTRKQWRISAETWRCGAYVYVVTACDIFDTTCSRFIQKWTVAILIDEEHQFSMIFHDYRTYILLYIHIWTCPWNPMILSWSFSSIILIYHYHRHRVSMISLSFSMSPTAWSRWSRWSPITFARQWPVPVEWFPKKRGRSDISGASWMQLFWDSIAHHFEKFPECV